MAKNERALMLAIALLTSSVAQAQDGGSDATPTDPPSGPSGSPVGAADRPDEDAGDDDEAPSYGDAGTWELGGSVGGLWTEDVFTLNVRPSVGLFLIDYLELSLLVDVEYENVRDDDGTRTSGLTFAVLVEPSYHVPIVEETLYLLGGLGVGVGYDGDAVGLDLVPRVGANIALGPGRMLNPAVRVPIIMGVEVDDNGNEHFETNVSFGFEIGYSTVF